ncbi:MAG TPA: alpha/beta hydrolase-fold protein, partial [Roseimicrobium sp.]|nr:alpha/beta hydrolase-fold protein [Roseimicrobium sp.]
MRSSWKLSLCIVTAVMFVHHCASAAVRGAEAPAPTTQPTLNPKSGFWEVNLESEDQAGPTLVEILLPQKLDPAKEYPVLYVLPVGGEHKDPPVWGHGLVEAKKAGIADKYDLICVAPTFSIHPWLGNHATDRHLRQEDYVLKTLIPYVDRTYRTQRSKEGRWLVGFSKSGWGAYTLIFRHPDVIGYAAAWDAPLMMNGENTGKNWGPMGANKVYGTKENFLKFLPSVLAKEAAPAFKERQRLVLGVGKHWKPQCESFHDLLKTLEIPHGYNPDLLFEHRWDTGWFAPLVDELVRTARQ